MIWVYLIITLLAGGFIFFAFYAAFIGGSPFAPADRKKVKKMIEVLGKHLKKGAIILDLGSGDGRILFEAYRAGFRAIGYEINPYLVWYTKVLIFIKSFRRADIYNRIQVITKDYFKGPLPKIDAITIFAQRQMMAKIEEKILAEGRKDIWVVSFSNPFYQTKPREVIEGNIYLYKV